MAKLFTSWVEQATLQLGWREAPADPQAHKPSGRAEGGGGTTNDPPAGKFSQQVEENPTNY